MPAGAESLLVQPLLPFKGGVAAVGSSAAAPGQGGDGSGGVLVLVSERARSLSSKERAWASAVAAKLHAALS